MNRTCTDCGTANALRAKECKNCGKVFAQLEAVEQHAIPAICEHLGCRHRIGYSIGVKGGGPYYCWRHGPLAKHGYVEPPKPQTVADVQAEADLYCRQHGLDAVAKRQAHIAKLCGEMPAWKLAGPAFREPGIDDDL